MVYTFLNLIITHCRKLVHGHLKRAVAGDGDNGFTGQFSLGTAGFMAVGAYATALLIMPVPIATKH